jgi:L-ascorbate metabolism protein UlaG (beta-lactamase superfamily)
MARIDISLPAGVPRAVTSTGSLTFIGNATVLFEIGGFTFLTDPNFIHRHEKIPLGHGLQATRLTDPAIELADLPPLDFVLLSHFHGDHFDQVAERDLDKDLLILTTPEAAEELQSRGFRNVHGLPTWETAELKTDERLLNICSVPGMHGPPIVNFALPDVMGSVLELKTLTDASELRLYITGDTLPIDELEEIPRRMGDIDLALLHLGGTRVLGITVSMDDEQGVRLIDLVEPQMAIPIHYDDYDVFKSPLSDFRRRVVDAGLEEKVRYVERGERFEFGLPWQVAPVPKAQRGDDIEYEGESGEEDEDQLR